MLQAITRNPLAEPATLGLTAGGALTVTLVAAYASLAPGAPTIAVAFVGVLAGTALIGAMAAAGGGGIRLILAGMAVGLALAAAARRGPARAGDRDQRAVPVGRGLAAAERLGAAEGRRPDRHARAARRCSRSRARSTSPCSGRAPRARSGCAPGLTQVGAVILAAVLTAVAVGLCGPIAFVGILAGGIARAARPRGHLGMLLVALPWGAAILLCGRRRRPRDHRPGHRDARRAWCAR